MTASHRPAVMAGGEGWSTAEAEVVLTIAETATKYDVSQAVMELRIKHPQKRWLHSVSRNICWRDKVRQEAGLRSVAANLRHTDSTIRQDVQ